MEIGDTVVLQMKVIGKAESKLGKKDNKDMIELRVESEVIPHWYYIMFIHEQDLEKIRR